MPERAAMRVVLIGYGPVGARLVEGLLPSVESGSVALTVVGAEVHDVYNRVLLAEYAVGRCTRERLELADTAAATRAGVQIRLGEVAVAVDRHRRVVRLDSGEFVAYDRLVFATGARANIPTLAGLEKAKRHRLARASRPAALDHGEHPLPTGVAVLRTLEDAEIVRAAIAARKRIVVLGAGVLGMELALAVTEQGNQTVAVYAGEIPMAKNLDRGAGRVLARAARSAGVDMAPHSPAESVILATDDDGQRRFDALICADGKQIAGDLLVLSCGVTGRTELAAAAGLTVSAGIVVDEFLRSWDDTAVFAIGDCAHIAEQPAPAHSGQGHVAGAPSGLIGPGWRQADWLANRLAAEARAPEARSAPGMSTDVALAPEARSAPGMSTDVALAPERIGVVMLKAEGVDVVSAGNTSAELWDEPHPVAAGETKVSPTEVSQWADPAHGAYVKMVTRDGVLTGFVAVGMPRAGAELTLLFESRSELPADRSVLLRLDADTSESAAPTDAFAPHSTVCWCNGVTVQRIEAAVAEGHATTECIGRATRAGTGCGSCKGKITQILDRWQPAVGL